MVPAVGSEHRDGRMCAAMRVGVVILDYWGRRRFPGVGFRQALYACVVLSANSVAMIFACRVFGAELVFRSGFGAEHAGESVGCAKQACDGSKAVWYLCRWAWFSVGGAHRAPCASGCDTCLVREAGRVSRAGHLVHSYRQVVVAPVGLSPMVMGVSA